MSANLAGAPARTGPLERAKSQPVQGLAVSLFGNFRVRSSVSGLSALEEGRGSGWKS